MAKEKPKTKPKRFAKLRHNWSWWDTIIGFIGGAAGGWGAALWLDDARWEAVSFLTEYVDEIVQIFLITFLVGRMIAVARWPRAKPLDYNKITPSGVVAANFVTIILGAMALITLFALVAPKVLETLAEHSGG